MCEEKFLKGPAFTFRCHFKRCHAKWDLGICGNAGYQGSGSAIH